MHNLRVTLILLGALVVGAVGADVLSPAHVAGAETYQLKIAHFVPPFHPMSKYLERWARDLEKQSGGRLRFTVIPGAQMGPPPKYYDMARTGQADITWFLHGATPGRFPLTELSHLPYLVGSAEIGAKVLNDPELRATYLDKEHRGVRVLYLFTHQPGQIHTSEHAVRRVEDMQGLRIRFASTTIRDFVAALGATPVGIPPTGIAEGLQKGTIDGVFIDYGGAGIAFKLGPHIKYTTEMYSYVSSFGVAMHPKTYAKLPPDLQRLIDVSTTGVEAAIGHEWDKIDGPGKQLMQKAGMQPIGLSPQEDARFKAIGKAVADARIQALEAKGLPARAVYTMMQALAAKHAATSKNFWRQ